MNRRALLTTLPLAGLAAALPSAGARAQAAGGQPLPAVQRFRIGDRVVTALSDGAVRIDPALLAGIDAEGYAALMRDAFRNPETYRSAVNGFAIEAPEGLILVDAGTGAAMGPSLGHLPRNLEAAGYAPEDVTLLLVTHLHPDHVGGALDGEAARFPNAEMVVSRADHDFWTDAGARAGAPAEAQPFFDLAAAAVGAYRDRLRLVEGEQEVTPGVTALPLPGHTPGHTGYALGSGDAGLLIWADIVHVPPVQLARPEVSVAFDSDASQAAETRAAILDRAAADRLMVAGSHMTFPGLAHIEPEGDGYRAVPADYDYPEG